MRHRIRYAVVVWVVMAVFVLPLNAAAQARNPFEEHRETTAGFMIFDLLLVRPLSLGATLLGSAASIVALPLTAPTGETGYSLEKLVKEPARYTFTRSLGFF